MADAPGKVELSGPAFRKIVYHAAKYPSATVMGLLVGTFGKTVQVTDVIPLAHHWTTLSPMAEAGLALVRAHLACS